MSDIENQGMEKKKIGMERSPTETDKNPDVLRRKIRKRLAP
ncbi:hypothetical protein [Algoriphagus confluentis]